MNRTLSALGTFGALSLAALINTECTNHRNSPEPIRIQTKISYQRPQVQLNTPENIKKHELRRITEQDSPYNLEGVVICGTPFYEIPNKRNNLNEYHTTIVLKKDCVKEIDRDGKKLNFSYKTVYIPILAEDSETDDGKKHKFTFRKDGDYAVNATSQKLNTQRIETGIFREVQDNATFSIRTITLGGEEFYVPYAKKEELKELIEKERNGESLDRLKFSMIPVNGTKLIIADDGEISLWSERGIYVPRKTSKEDFNTKEKSPVNSGGQEE